MVFENPSLQLSVKRSHYKRGHKFSLHDSLFKVQIIPKNDTKSPLYFKDLLEIMDEGLKYIMTNLKSHFPDNQNAITYLTLYQKGMLNGLSTGGYELSNESENLVDKLMQMLSNFLISNENITVNNEFNIYVDVYSKKHTDFKRKNIYKGRKLLEGGKNFWAIDIQQDSHPSDNYLNDKCLLASIVLGHFQNNFFESKDNRFQFASNINSTIQRKRIHAYNTIKAQVLLLVDYLNDENIFDYHNLDKVAPMVHKVLDCQIFVFSGFDYKIQYMYPKLFDESLRPIYLFNSNDSLEHIVFIKNLKCFFNSSKVKSCFFCKNAFKTINTDHQCEKRPTCRACKRHFSDKKKQPSKMLFGNFCSKPEVESNDIIETCTVCNVKLLNQHCKFYHSKLCGRKGCLGYYCQQCDKFIERTNGINNAEQISEIHKCNERFCRLCKMYFSENNHLCQLKHITFKEENFCLAFLTMEFVCEKDNSPVTNETPNIIVIYKEQQPSSGSFDSFTISDFAKNMAKDSNAFYNDYCPHKGQSISKLKISKTFDQKLTLAEKLDGTVLEKFVGLLCQWTSVTILCADENGFIFNAFIKAFIKANINLKILCKGKKFFSCEVPELKIRLLNSTNYLPGDEYQVAEVSNLTYNQLYFPFKLNEPSNYNYKGKIPDVSYFICQHEEKESIKNKKHFVDNYDQEWGFQEQLIAFSQQKTYLLCASVCMFLKEMITMQRLMFDIVNPNNINKNKILSPFSKNICTLSRFIFCIFKGLFLRDEEIFIVKNEYHVPSRKISKTEFEFCKYLEFKYPDVEIIHNYSNINGQKFFKESIPDLYIPSLQTAIFVNGCYFHGHYASKNNQVQEHNKTTQTLSQNSNLLYDQQPNQEFCILSKPAFNDTPHRIKKINYEILQKEFFEKLGKLKANNKNEIKDVKVYWECFIRKILFKNKDYQIFKESFKKHPLQRLIPRTLCKGGFIQTFALTWNKKQFPNENFYCCDVNGLYSHAAMSESYNIGKFQVLIGKDLTEITLFENKFYYKGKKLYGTIQATILPPKHLYFPFLISEHQNKSVLTLCRKCFLNKTVKCKHTDNEREFFGSYFVEELEFSLKLGYQISAIHECHAYFEQKPIFQKFVSILNYNKIKHSSYLSSFSNQFEKENYCTYLNQKMNLSNPYALTSQDKSNSYKKFLYKLAANSLFGKFQQRKDTIVTHTIGDDEELEKFINQNKNQIKSIQCFEDTICQVLLQPKNTEIKDSLETNCYLGAQIVANARIYFYSQVEKVLRHPESRLYYCDTDSIFFTLPQNLPNPLTMSEATGDFKNVYENITDFHCLGPKNYSISYSENKKFQNCTKIRGLNLNSFDLKSSIDGQIYKDYLNAFLHRKTKQIKVPQTRVRKTKSLPFSKKSKIELLTFSNKISSSRRIVKKSLNLFTVPYGYIEK